MATANPKTKPVRAGDVYQYDATRVATVMRTRPGGIAELRISGQLNGRHSLRLGDEPVAQVKARPFLGRAPYQDGMYLQIEAKDYLPLPKEPAMIQ